MIGRLVAGSFFQNPGSLWRVPEFLLDPVQDLIEPGIVLASVSWTGSSALEDTGPSTRTCFARLDESTNSYAFFTAVLYARKVVCKLMTKKWLLQIWIASSSHALIFPVPDHYYPSLWEVSTGEPCSSQLCHAHSWWCCAQELCEFVC